VRNDPLTRGGRCSHGAVRTSANYPPRTAPTAFGDRAACTSCGATLITPEKGGKPVCPDGHKQPDLETPTDE